VKHIEMMKLAKADYIILFLPMFNNS